MDLVILEKNNMEDIPMLFVLRAKQQLNILGFWFPPENATMKFIYRSLTLISFFLIYSMIVLQTVYIANVWRDLDAVSEAIFMLFTLASVAFKMTNFYRKMEKLVELFRLMEIHVFQPKNENDKRVIEFEARRIRGVCTFFFGLVCSTCSLWAVRPFLDGSDKYTLPFHVWMPLSTKRSPHFELACVYQNAAVFASGLLFNGIDNVPLSMIMFVCAQLRIIEEKVLKMSETGENRKRRERGRDRAYERLRGCVQHHQAVFQFIAQVETLYQSNIFFHVCGSVGIICIIGLRIYIVAPLSVQCFSMVSFLLAMLTQLFVYCWCGHKLTNAGESLRDALYLCNWHTQGPSFNRALWIVMERTKRPITFRTGQHVVLSMATFVAILRSSYSYFAVLKQVRDK